MRRFLRRIAPALLILVVVGVLWGERQRRTHAHRQRVADAIEAAGGTVLHQIAIPDWADDSILWVKDSLGITLPRPKSVYGVEFRSDTIYEPLRVDGEIILMIAEAYPDVVSLVFKRAYPTEAALAEIGELENLCQLELKGVYFAPLNFGAITSLSRLQVLVLVEANLKDTDVLALATATNLRGLDIEHADIGDQSIDVLASMPNLEGVCLFGTRISEAGVNRLRKAKPNLQIDWYPLDEGTQE